MYPSKNAPDKIYKGQDIFNHPEALLYLDGEIVGSADRHHDLIALETKKFTDEILSSTFHFEFHKPISAEGAEVWQPTWSTPRVRTACRCATAETRAASRPAARRPGRC